MPGQKRRHTYSHIYGRLLMLQMFLFCLLVCFFTPFILYFTDGQLRHTKTGEPFVFNAREDLHRWNQKRYEALGEVTDCFLYWDTT